MTLLNAAKQQFRQRRNYLTGEITEDLPCEVILNFQLKNMFYYVYVLLSKKDKKFYVGYTENLKLRFEHKFYLTGCK